MRGVLASTLVLALCAAGCGGARSDRSATSAATASVPVSFPGGSDRDRDNDRNDDDSHIVGFGQAADAASRDESVALVDHYFADAAVSNGAAGCRLLVPFIAEALSEMVGHDPNASCAAALSGYFRPQHRALVEKHRTMRAVAVRVEGNRGLVLIAFPTLREVHQITIRRVAGRWRLLQVLDEIVE